MPEWLQCTISHLFKRLSSSYDRMVMVNCIYIHNLFIIILKVIKSIIIIIIMCWYSNSNNFFPKRNPSFAVLGCIIVINVCFFSSLLFSSLLFSTFPSRNECVYWCIALVVLLTWLIACIGLRILVLCWLQLVLRNYKHLFIYLYIYQTHMHTYTHTPLHTHTHLIPNIPIFMS